MQSLACDHETVLVSVTVKVQKMTLMPPSAEHVVCQAQPHRVQVSMQSSLSMHQSQFALGESEISHHFSMMTHLMSDNSVTWFTVKLYVYSLWHETRTRREIEVSLCVLCHIDSKKNDWSS
jgi:hypothetical protein